MKVILISCVSKKIDKSAKAKDLYISPLFIKSLVYAQKLGSDRIFILSAKYGLVDSEQIIEPYDETLNTKGIEERKNWADKVLQNLKKVADLQKDEFIILAGQNYYEFLVPSLVNVKLPLGRLSIGKRLQWLKENT
ncbi:MAG: hypothetical protein FWE16_00595 [Firmicutes bacterium]|nr:hypothetical protein [Bacillota bacterium]